VVKTLGIDKGWVWTAQYSADGTRLMTESETGDARIWACQKAVRCTEVFRFPEEDSGVKAVLSPSGSKAATWAYGSSVWLWNVDDCLAKPKCKSRTIATPGVVISADFDRDENLLATGGDRGFVRVWQLEGARKTPLHLLDTNASSIDELHFDPKPGKTKYLAGLGDKSVFVWDLAKCGKAKPTPTPTPSPCRLVRVIHNTEWVKSIAFSPSQNELAVATEDGTTRVWSLATDAAPLLVLPGHTASPFNIAFSPDGTRLISGGADRTARLWDVSTGLAFVGHTDWVTSAAFNRDGNRVVTSSFDKTARIWDAKGRQLAQLKGPDRLDSAAFGADDTLVVASGELGETMVWNVAQCERRRVCQPARVLEVGGVAVAVSPTEDFGVTASDQGRAPIFDLKTKRTPLRTLVLDPTKQAFATAFSPDGRYLAISSTNGKVYVYDVSGCTRTSCAPQLLTTLPHRAIPYAVAFGPDGKTIVTGSGDGVVQIWDWQAWQETKAEPRSLSGLTGLVRAVAVSPHGLYIASVGADRRIHIWRATTGDVVAVVRLHADRVDSLAFSPRSDTAILTASDDRTARIYRCETCVPLGELRRLAERRMKAMG
jgi:WD40 repeat protein